MVVIITVLFLIKKLNSEHAPSCLPWFSPLSVDDFETHIAGLHLLKMLELVTPVLESKKNRYLRLVSLEFFLKLCGALAKLLLEAPILTEGV